MSLKLTERDLKILKYVFENRVASTKQIKNFAFVGKTDAVVSRRLRMLSREGYLKIIALVGVKSSYVCYQPTEKGFRYLEDAWPFFVDNPLYKSESPWHDVHVGDIRTRLEKLVYFDAFYPENLLQSSRALSRDYRYEGAAMLQADGVLDLKSATASGTFAVEVELNRKTHERYRRKLSNYYSISVLSGVFYICPTQGLIDAIAKVDDEVRGDKESILFFALEKNVLSAPDKIVFSQAGKTGRTISLALQSTLPTPVNEALTSSYREAS